MEAVKVLQVSTNYHGGGAERCARELHDAMASRGVDMHMAVANRQPNMPDNVRCIRTQIERVLFPLNFLPTINDWRHKGSIGFFDRLSHDDFDVVHLHNIHGNWLSVRAVQRLAERIPTVWTLHDAWAATGGIPYDLTDVMSLAKAKEVAAACKRHGFPVYPNAKAKRWRRFLERATPRAKQIVAPSRWLADLAGASPLLEGMPIERVPYGVSLLGEPAINLSREDAKKRQGVPTDHPCILMIAADLKSPYKGMSLGTQVIRASLKGLGRHPPCVLLLGRNTESIRHELAGAYTPVVCDYASSAEQLAVAYRAADLTLVPSVADNLPYTVLESFACETPVAAFDVGGIPEMVSPGATAEEPHHGVIAAHGALAAPFEIEALAKAVATLLHNPAERHAKGEAARAWVTKHCSMDRFADHMRDVYDRVAAM